MKRNYLHKFCRLPKDDPFYEKIMKIHKASIERNEPSYIDPKTGYTVFTALYLENIEYCCGSGCRHCPYAEDSES